MMLISASYTDAKCPPDDAEIYSPCKMYTYVVTGSFQGNPLGYNTVGLNCSRLNLDDDATSEVLDRVLSECQSTLLELRLPLNQLTRVPDQVARFERLGHIALGSNRIQTIPWGVFNFENGLRYLDLQNNSLSSIEAGALHFPSGISIYNYKSSYYLYVIDFVCL